MRSKVHHRACVGQVFIGQCTYTYQFVKRVLFSSIPTAYFVVRDRGMGIVSFETRKYPGFRLRMENQVLKGKVSSWGYVMTMGHDGPAIFVSHTLPP